MNYIKRLFTQTASWKEIVPAASSLTAEAIKVHDLESVRISVESIGEGVETSGNRSNSSAVLYWLIGKSTCDGYTDVPEFKCGDMISTPKRDWTVVSVAEYSSLLGGDNHLEVKLS